MDKRIVFVLLGGKIGSPDFLIRMRDLGEPVAIICADGGARHAREAGLNPTLVVGDLDSLSEEEKSQIYREGIPHQVHPVAKDETDGVLACQRALALAPDEIWVFGALGGRVDHLLANLSLLLMGEKWGVSVKLIDEECEIFLVSGEKTIEGKEGEVVSILALFEDAAGVDLEGFYFPLTQGEIKRDFPLGISNHLAREKASIRVKTGQLLVIKYFSPLGE